MTIKDLITFEVIGGLNRQDAIKETKRRVKIHKSNFTYGRKGHHYSVNVTYKIEGNLITIYKEN